MACFDNLITIEGLCDPAESTSGYTLNQIGIDKTEVESIITKGYTVDSFINEKQQFAVKKVTGDIYSFLSPKYRADSILASNRIGYPSDQKTLQTQAGNVGINIHVGNRGSYVDYVISDFSLFLDYTGDVDVWVYDVEQGKLLDTITVASVAGQISSISQKSIITALKMGLNLWVGYDSTGINSYLTQTHNGCSDCGGYTFSHRMVQATGASIQSPFTVGQITNLTHTGGLSLRYSINCNHTDWLCDYTNLLSQPILYKTGALICNHALMSSPNQRVMSNVILNVELMQKKHDYFQAEYDHLMRNILSNMQVPQDKNCFHCDQRIISRSTLA